MRIIPGPVRNCFRSKVFQLVLLYLLSFILLPVLTLILGIFHVFAVCGLLILLLAALLFKPVLKPQNITALGIIFAIIWVPLFIGGFLAPFRAFVLFLLRYYPELPYYGPFNFENLPRMGAFYDTAVAFSGILFVLAATGVDTFWRLKQARQIHNLPTSRARSAALGIAEFQGRAIRDESQEAGTSDPLIFYQSGTPRVDMRPFYLEDKTGKILVDPEGAELRTGWASSIGGRICEIVLTRRATRGDFFSPATRCLKHGDPVYLIGNVMRRDNALTETLDSDALVVKPLKEPRFPGHLWQMLFGQAKPPPQRNIQHIFFLSDSTEHTAHRHILRGIREIWLVSLFWILPCLWMLSVQQPRMSVNYENWMISEVVRYAPREHKKDALLSFLKAPNPGTRIEALDALQPYAEKDSAIAPLLIDLLEDPDRQVRIRVVSQLYRIRVNENSISRNGALIRLLSSGENEVRRLTAYLLKFTGGQPADMIPPLTKALVDSYAPVRINAAVSLGTFDPLPDVTILSLESLLEDPDEKVRATTIQVLRRITLKPEKALLLFSRHLNHMDPVIRVGVLEALGDLGSRASGISREIEVCMKDPDLDVRRQAVLAYGNIGPARPTAIESMMTFLKDEYPGMRKAAATALGRMGPAASPAIPQLRETLKDPDSSVRKETVQSLGEIGADDPVTVSALGIFLREENTYVRRAAGSVLQRMGKKAEPALESVMEGLKHRDDETVLLSVKIIRNLGPAGIPVIPNLASLMEHSDKRIRREAAVALGEMGPAAESAIPVLERSLSDSDRQVSTHAREALDKIHDTPERRKNLQVLKTSRFEPEDLAILIDLLKDHDLHIRQRTIRALGTMGPESAPAVPVLVTMLKSETVNTRSMIVRTVGMAGALAYGAVPDLIPLLRDRDSYLRLCTAEALGNIGPGASEAVVELEKLLGDTDDNIRAVSASALGKIGPRARLSIPFLIRALKDPSIPVRQSAVYSLKQIGTSSPEMVSSLADALTDQDYLVRKGAAEALEALGSDAAGAVPQLVAALNDDDIRQQVVCALGAMGPEATEALPFLQKFQKEPLPPYLKHSIDEAVKKIKTDSY